MKEMGINIKNEGIRPNSDLYELNPDHTHFIFVDEEDRDRMFFTNIRCQLEQQFQYGVGRKRRLRRLFSWGNLIKKPSCLPYSSPYTTCGRGDIPVASLTVCLWVC